MFNIGDVVMYSKVGACKVVKIGKLDIKGIDNDRRYYTLDPIYESGTLFVPTDTKMPLRSILSKEKVDSIIDSMPEIETGDPLLKRAYDVKNAFNARLDTQQAEDLITVIKTIFVKDKVAKESGKNISATDQGYLKKAEQLLYGEFALSLGIAYDQVKEYIEKRLRIV